jgi:DNA gyrase subunit A
MALEESENNQEDKENQEENNQNPEPINNSSNMDDSHIQSKEIEEEMKNSYMDYAMSVIVGRALPDARDGLKPVHRRVLYTMFTSGLLHNKPFKKSANVVGNCMAKFHPHGDSAIYDTLVRMAQPFSLRYPLVHGQGNFGSIDGDSAAAMRYTEAKMQKISEDLLADIDKETVEFRLNFDESTKEPTVLPAKVPNLLINGSSGIAVGMATNIPPHNLNEVSDAVIHLIENSDASVTDLMNFIKAPDFPTGAKIMGRSGIHAAYHTGRGRVIMRAKHHIEENKAGKKKIIFTQIPYQVNKSILLENIADLVKTKKIEGISDIRDESDRDGMRIVFELSRSCNEEILLNNLYKHSRLQDSFGINMVALVNNRPVTLNLKNSLQYFIDHRFEVVKKRTEYELKKAKERAHILEGLIIALDHIDEIIKKIKNSKDVSSAKDTLMEDYKLTEIQAKVILEMRLQKLSSMEQDKIRDEYKDVLDLIKGLELILSDDNKIFQIIKDETLEIKTKYGDDRRSEIIEHFESDIEVEDLIDKEDMIVSITSSNYVKKVPLDTYKQQNRGGKGVIATGKKEDDYVKDLFVANTHDHLLIFTDAGRMHWLKVYRIPTSTRQAKGLPLVNLLDIPKEEKITSILPISEFKNQYVIMCTQKGIIKKVTAELFARPRKGGIIAINLDDGDRLVSSKITDGKQNLLLATHFGKAIKFMESDIRSVGRTARGVRGIRLKPKDYIVGMVIARDENYILTVTENGYGKRTPISEYRLIHRGGGGVINIICSERNGNVIGI